MKIFLPIEILEFTLERQGYLYKCGGFWMTRANVLDIIRFARYE